MPAKPKAKAKPKTKAAASPAGKTVYRFKVRLISGPFTREKGQRRPVRVIDIRGDQTLDALHEAIFYAFDREDMHLYEFQIGGEAPLDDAAELYGLPGGMEEAKDARKTKIASLKLRPGHVFFYWFDFGDDWWHEITVEAVLSAEAGVEYPILVKSLGASPPQYPEEDEEDEEEEDDEEEDEDEDEDEEGEGDEAAANDVRMIRLAECRNPDQARMVILASLGSARRKPKRDLERLVELLTATTAFCADHLDDEYAYVCLRLLLHADQDTKLPLERGAAAGWAAGLVHAAGFVNFLGDPSTEPYMKIDDIAGHFGVSKATMSNKSRDIRQALDIIQMEPRFSTRSMLAENPLVWFRQNADGLIIDLRDAPREMQEAAFDAGLIPWIPADHPELHRKRQPQPASKNAPPEDPRQGSLLDIMPGGKKKG